MIMVQRGVVVLGNAFGASDHGREDANMVDLVCVLPESLQNWFVAFLGRFGVVIESRVERGMRRAVLREEQNGDWKLMGELEVMSCGPKRKPISLLLFLFWSLAYSTNIACLISNLVPHNLSRTHNMTLRRLFGPKYV